MHLNKNGTLNSIPFHTFWFALFPVLSLLSFNVQETQISEAYRSIWIVLLFAAGALLAARFIFREWRKAGIFSSLLILLFFSYGHVYTLLHQTSIPSFTGGVHRFLAPGWVLIFFGCLWAVGSSESDFRPLTRFLNLVAGLSLLIPLYTIGAFLMRSPAGWSGEPSGPDAASRQLRLEEGDPAPDIYYIILDAYARSDVLREQFDYDNSSFISFLKEQGFYVAEESVSNYLRTTLSLGSSLNMNYLDHLGLDLSRVWETQYMQEPISHSAVRSGLESIGYAIVSMPSGYRPTEILDVDLYLTPNMPELEALEASGAFNAFEGILVQTTAARIVTDLDALRHTPVREFVAERLKNRKEITREIVLSAFGQLGEIPRIPGPKLVFVHIVSPHEPYMFGPNGENIIDTEAYTLANTSPENELQLYLDQLTYITSKVQQTISAILSRSVTPPVIIMQADHGPGFEMDWDDPDPAALRTRMSILNAYLLPYGCDRQLYRSITPVNSFRLVFNCYFAGSFPLLEDETYFMAEPGSDQPFVNVRDILD